MRSLGLKESKDRAGVLGGLGKRGRPKKRFRNRARGYAAVATVAVLGGAALLYRNSKLA
jgi:hypothetical protein